MSSPASSGPRRQARLDKVQRIELRHKIELHHLAGRVIECPIDEMNRPRPRPGPQLRIPPAGQVGRLFAGWREELVSAASRPGRPESRGRPADGRCRAADQRGPQARPR